MNGVCLGFGLGMAVILTLTIVHYFNIGEHGIVIQCGLLLVASMVIVGTLFEAIVKEGSGKREGE